MSINHKAEYKRFLALNDRSGAKRKAESDLDSEQDYEEEENSYDYDGCKSIKVEAAEFQVISQDNLEFIGVSGQPEQNPRNIPSTSELMQENRFINLVYPEFAGKTRLQLIDEIRLLRDKNKVYKRTIDQHLNN